DAAGDRPALRGGGGVRRDRALPPDAGPQRPPGLPPRPRRARALGRAVLGRMSGRTVVVGAGLSGLTAALASVRRGDETVLLEASDRPGGVVRSERRTGYLLELGPNTVRPTPEIVALVRELGLEGDAVYADARLPRYVDFGGALHAVPMSPGGLL